MPARLLLAHATVPFRHCKDQLRDRDVASVYVGVAARVMRAFLQHFEHMFNWPNHAGFTAERLFMLRQGSRSVADYAVEFGILAAEAGCDEFVLQAAFCLSPGEQRVPHLMTSMG